MLRPIALARHSNRRILRSLATMSANANATTMENTMRSKLQSSLSPTSLTIRNDSHLHAHHEPMRGNTSTETHFHVTIISSAFASKGQPARHRMVYAALKEEMAQESGIHALQLRTRTPEEEERDAAKE